LEDTATVTLDLMSGTGEIYLTWAAEERANTIGIEGEHGQINIASDRVVLKTGSGEQQWSCPPALSEGSHHQDWFVGVAEDFRIAAAAGGQRNLGQAVLCGRSRDAVPRSNAAGGAGVAIGD